MIDVEDVPFSWFKNELRFSNTLKNGDKNKKVKFSQECLTLSGHHLVIDGNFGPATEGAVKDYQSSYGISVTGTINKATFEHLRLPFLRALTPIASTGSLSDLSIAYAEQHLKEHPREVGGQNRGPWVRLYMGGNEGEPWPWCAGFVTLVVNQASKYHSATNTVKRTYSCDVLADRAKNNGLFVSEAKVKASGDPSSVLPKGTIFLVRKSSIDWTHTGMVLEAKDDTIITIEGNTNDEGSREGYEVCRRIRNYKKKDFIVY